MDSQSDHLSVTPPEAQVESDQVALAIDDEPVSIEDKAEFAPPFPEPVVALCVPNIDDTDEIADVEIDTLLLQTRPLLTVLLQTGRPPLTVLLQTRPPLTRLLR
jgi:hypothetical protein